MKVYIQHKNKKLKVRVYDNVLNKQNVKQDHKHLYTANNLDKSTYMDSFGEEHRRI